MANRIIRLLPVKIRIDQTQTDNNLQIRGIKIPISGAHSAASATENQNPKHATSEQTSPSNSTSSNVTDVDAESIKTENTITIEKKEEKPQEALTDEKPETCPICLEECTQAKKLDKCGHQFCRDCIEPYFANVKPQCPCCFTIYGEIRGNQPENGQMIHKAYPQRLPGFERASGTIKITYTFPNGIQNETHPNPGQPYYGTTREAFLPDNSEGRRVLKLLEKAFKLRQVFTVGQSRTTGHDNVITWNDIHHKTSAHGGMENFGYPDHTYLNRVQQELAAKGIF